MTKSGALHRLKHEITVQWRLRFRPKIITIDGLRVCADRRLVSKTISKVLYRGHHELPERQLAGRFLHRGDRVLEIGAGVGLVSLVCARLVGAENLLSYEANPALEEVIRLNFRLNGMEANLRIAAAAPEAGETTFYFARDLYSSSLIDRHLGKAERVRCDALAAIVAEFKPTVLVMDVEGAEVDLLPVADLSGIDKMLLELHPWIVGQERIDDLIALIGSKGFVLREQIEASYAFSR